MFVPVDNTMLCPFSRTFAATPATPLCRGAECALWRWERITVAHPAYKDAVKSRADETGEKVPYPKAARHVADNLETYGLIPTRGYCGAGGEP
jgi:hypothetical protein